MCKLFSLICILCYVKTNIVTYRIRSDAQLVSLCLTGTLLSNKSDSHMLAYIISSDFLLTLFMHAYVSAAEALVLICADTICFAITRLVGGGDVSGVCQVCVTHCEFNFQLQISDVTKLNTLPLHLILEPRW